MKSLQLLALLLCALALPTLAADESKAKIVPGTKSARNVGVEEFDKLRADKNTVVLDVRTEKEFKAGHIPGAINLDYNGPDFAKKVGELDKSKIYLVHCAGGVRSARACVIMDRIAFTNAVNLEPGFKAWEKAGKPVEKK